MLFQSSFAENACFKCYNQEARGDWVKGKIYDLKSCIQTGKVVLSFYMLLQLVIIMSAIKVYVLNVHSILISLYKAYI